MLSSVSPHLQVNKLAVHHLPLPGIVTACQFSSCALIVYSCKIFGLLHTDDFEWSKAKYYLIYVLSFSIGTYTNMKVLSMANVETVIGACARRRMPAYTAF